MSGWPDCTGWLLGGVDVDYCLQVPLVELCSRLVEAVQMSGWPDCTGWLLGWCSLCKIFTGPDFYNITI